jgi:hypothetical protein
MMLRFTLSLVAFLVSTSLYAQDYATAFAQALKNNVPLVVGVGHEPTAPSGWASCRVASFDKAQDGDLIVLIPSEGSMWRVEVKGDLETSVASIRQSWQLTDALDEVNQARARRGLRPFLRDHGLTVAAASAARYRAAHRMAGHTPNDFAHLPSGSQATSAGCAAWPASMGWGSCCWEENWTYAGASYAMGPDGLRYMHIFVR